MSTIRTLPPLHDKKCYDPNLPAYLFPNFILHFVGGTLPLPFSITLWEVIEQANQIFVNYIEQTNKNAPFNHPIIHPFIHRSIRAQHLSRQIHLGHAHSGRGDVERLGGLFWFSDGVEGNVLTRHIFSITTYKREGSVMPVPCWHPCYEEVSALLEQLTLQ